MLFVFWNQCILGNLQEKTNFTPGQQTENTYKHTQFLRYNETY